MSFGFQYEVVLEHLHVFLSPWYNAIYRGLRCKVALELFMYLLDLEFSLISIKGHF